MQNTEENIKDGEKLLHETELSFKSIVSSINEVFASNGVVALAVKEQSLGIQNVNESTGQLAAGIEHNSAAMNEVSSSIGVLTDQAGNMNTLVDKFKI